MSKNTRGFIFYILQECSSHFSSHTPLPVAVTTTYLDLSTCTTYLDLPVAAATLWKDRMAGPVDLIDEHQGLEEALK